MLIVVFFEPDMVRIERMMQHIADTFPEITSLLYIVNQKRNDTIADQEVCVFRGRDYIWESMEGLRFKIGPKSFYQTNSEQAYELYKVAREFAGLTGTEMLLYKILGKNVLHIAGIKQSIIQPVYTGVFFGI